MQRISTIAAAAVWASQAFAAPAPMPQVGTNVEISGPVAQGFRVQQVVGPSVVKSGPIEMQKTYNKFNVAAPPQVASAAKVAAAALQSGSVAANPEAYDESYLCPVTVGSIVCWICISRCPSDLTLADSQPRFRHRLDRSVGLLLRAARL